MLPAALCLAAYVLGSIPTGLLVGRARGVDIRAIGSGNIGATNVARGLGKPWAVLVLVLDALKGFLPVFLARHLTPALAPAAVALVGLCAVVGHMFTIFLRGHGGKGVATSLGVAFGLSPPLALLSLTAYAVAYAVTRLSSVGSLLGMWSFPVLAATLGEIAPEFMVLSIVTAALVTYRHRENLRRLWRGEESRPARAERSQRPQGPSP
jgi:acyl phosphate:glycerol-3-phosphate acyltransferase